MQQALSVAARAIKNSNYFIAHTGAGISVESGVPPFRGAEGLWNRYEPQTLELNFFLSNPEESWKVIREIFYSFLGKVQPNPAHRVLAAWEKKGLLKAIITQNIDDLHQMAGSDKVFEFHGNAKRLVCLECGEYCGLTEIDFDFLPPYCEQCGGLLKPDFIFFSEGIPQKAYEKSIEAASSCDVLLIIGTTGEVSPANQMPLIAKENGAFIIEVNPDPSLYTNYITDIFIKTTAGAGLPAIDKCMQS